MADSLAEISFVYDSYDGDSAPIVTTLTMASSTVPDQTALTDLVAALQTNWNDNMAVLLSTSTMAGHMDVQAVIAGNVVDVSVVLDDGADGVGANSLAGASYRIIKGAPRPPGGKPGSMYIGGIKDNFTARGVIAGGTLTAVNGHVGDFYNALLGTGDWRPVIIRKISGVSSSSDILSLSCAPKVSFLNRRYK